MKVLLVTNPADDTNFRAAAEAYLNAAHGSPAELQHRLRASYPHATVTDGIVDRGAERWYAYRDGHWIG